MKKFFIISVIFTLALSSCVREELDPAKVSQNRMKIVFEGGFDRTQTRMIVNDAVDGVHSLIWSEGDEIGIFSYDQTETFNNNIKAKLHDNSVGVQNGVFYPVEEVIVIPPTEEGGEPTEDIVNIQYPQNSDETFVVYYPYRKGTEINVDDGCIHSKVSSEQVLAAIGDRKAIANGFACGVAQVKAAEEKATFSLTHKLAYIAVKATSSEFSGYQLHTVQLFDRSGLAALSGEFSVNPISQTLTINTENCKSSVRADVAAHNFSETPERSELYLTVLPGDYSTADMYISVTFINAEGATKTIPMKFDKTCVFPQGSFTTIDLGDLGSSDNKFPWFEISEERDLIRLWAYGSQNTYMGCRSIVEGQATQVTIDVKPRGDFSKVKEPKYYCILACAEEGDPSRQYNRRLLSIDGKAASASMATPLNMTGDEWTPKGSFFAVSPDYTINIYILDCVSKNANGNVIGNGRWGTVAVCDENFDVLWTFMVSGYREDDQPKDVAYPGFTMMDRFLGQDYGNERAATEKTFNTAPPYFQWGRPTPFAGSNTQGRAHIYNYREDPVAEVGDAASIPTTKINAFTKWYEGDIRWDLWGGYNNTSDWYDPNETGHKTIYDPCPEGYRIPDAKVFKEVGDNAEIWESVNGRAPQVTDPASTEYYINTDSPFYKASGGYSVIAYPLTADTYDYWPFFGYLANQGNSYAGTGAKASGNLALLVWSNTAPGNRINGASAYCTSMEYAYFSSSRNFNTRHETFQCYAAPVRCQKDE